MRERLTETGQKEQYPAGESAGCLGGQDVDQLERISEPPQEDDGAGELDEAQEIGGVVLVPGDESTRPHHPGEEALDEPATFVAWELAAVLGLMKARRVVRGDHVDADGSKFCVELVAVVGFVADQSTRQLVDEASLQGVEDKLRFMPLTARKPAGDRKTVAVRHRHDLGCFATASDPNQSAPLLAPAWVPSMKASVRSIFPRSRRSSASPRSNRSRTPWRTHCWYRRWHVW